MSAKLDYVMSSARRHGAQAGARTAAGLLAEWIGRQFYKWQYPQVEWGRDIRITGKLVIRGTGRVVVGDGCFFDGASGQVNRISVVEPDALVVIGPGSYVNGVEIVAARRVQTGRSCWLGQCTILDTDFHPLEADARVRGEPGKVADVVLGDRVWLGTKVLVLKGVEIGDEAVVGAGAVVRRSVPARTLAVGEQEQPRAG